MTIITVESDSEEKTLMLLQYIEELGLSAQKNEHRVLTDHDVAFGIGRRATEAELTEYFLSTEDDERIDIEVLRAKYSS